MNATPLYARRKPGLGRYNGTRKEWKSAWRYVRAVKKGGGRVSPRVPSLVWKASLILDYGRAEHCDPLTISLVGRLVAKKVIAEVVGEGWSQTFRVAEPRIPK